MVEAHRRRVGVYGEVVGESGVVPGGLVLVEVGDGPAIQRHIDHKDFIGHADKLVADGDGAVGGLARRQRPGDFLPPVDVQGQLTVAVGRHDVIPLVEQQVAGADDGVNRLRRASVLGNVKLDVQRAAQEGQLEAAGLADEDLVANPALPRGAEPAADGEALRRARAIQREALRRVAGVLRTVEHDGIAHPAIQAGRGTAALVNGGGQLTSGGGARIGGVGEDGGGDAGSCLDQRLVQMQVDRGRFVHQPHHLSGAHRLVDNNYVVKPTVEIVLGRFERIANVNAGLPGEIGAGLDTALRFNAIHVNLLPTDAGADDVREVVPLSIGVTGAGGADRFILVDAGAEVAAAQVDVAVVVGAPPTHHRIDTAIGAGRLEP